MAQEELFNKDNEFDDYRTLYINNLITGTFPYEAAYYYYTMHINRIDIMSLYEFKENLHKESAKYPDLDERFEKVSKPIYDYLDKYYEPNYVYNNDDAIIAIS